MNRIKLLWSNLSTTFWFVPSLIVAASIMLALVLIEVDASGSEDWLSRWPRIFGSGAEGARGMLSTISGSTMTVVGVTFSMTLVALTLASSQYTSRILRNFMSDRVTQIVLGIFAGIFSYCLIVLRTIRGGEDGVFIPSLAVTVAVVLAISGIVTLIFFIHHIASSIQASSITASVADETIAAVDRLFPEKLGDGRDGVEKQMTPTLSEWNWQAVAANKNGYIQSLDDSKLLGVASKHKTIVRMEHGVGDFVIQDTPLVSIVDDDPPCESVINELQNAFVIDRFRTVTQDASFGIRQLVDIALRSLSPGVNDTTTAIMCVDYLTAILSRLVTRDIPSSHRYEDDELRVVAIGPTFDNLVSISFDQIRDSAEGNVAIMLRMLGALETTGKLTSDQYRRRILKEQVSFIEQVGSRTIASKHDRERIKVRVSQVKTSLSAELALAPQREVR